MLYSKNVRFEQGTLCNYSAFESPYFLFWHQFNFPMWSYRNGKFWSVVTFREAPRPCAICVMKFMTYLLQQKCSFMTLSWSSRWQFLCVWIDRYLKSTMKKTMQLWKGQLFSHFHAQALTSGVCNKLLTTEVIMYFAVIRHFAYFPPCEVVRELPSLMELPCCKGSLRVRLLKFYS